MERTLYADLTAWKDSRRRKPLLLRGARQTGKTYLLREFGQREYERVAYCNFEAEPGLDSFFQRDLGPQRIISDLAVYKGFELRPEKDLLILDEIQNSNAALNSLKYFQEQANGYHIVAAGSLLGVQLSRPGSFPVGKVSFLDLHPMSFAEFLGAMGRPQYVKMLGTVEMEPLPEPIHLELLDLLRQYYFTGGMPEAVKVHAESRDAREVRTVQREILDSYELDFAKHAPSSDIPKLGLVWDSLPRHLAKENKKFMFSVVKKGARAREYENALRWLADTGLILLCHAVETSRTPLAHYSDRSCFKVYVVDVGLLGAMVGVAPELTVEAERLFTEYRGALAENYVAQQLVAAGCDRLYYWRSAGGQAELDFLLERGAQVVPVEVKAGVNLRSKSLQSYDQQFDPPQLLRTNLLNLKHDGKTCNVPLYAVPWATRLLDSVGAEAV